MSPEWVEGSLGSTLESVEEGGRGGRERGRRKKGEGERGRERGNRRKEGGKEEGKNKGRVGREREG